MAMPLPRQKTALLGVLVNQSQAARLNRAQDVSPELLPELIHRFILYSYDVLRDNYATLPGPEDHHELSRSTNRGDIHTNTVESAFLLLKRGLVERGVVSLQSIWRPVWTKCGGVLTTATTHFCSVTP